MHFGCRTLFRFLTNSHTVTNCNKFNQKTADYCHLHLQQNGKMDSLLMISIFSRTFLQLHCLARTRERARAFDSAHCFSSRCRVRFIIEKYRRDVFEQMFGFSLVS